MPSARQSCCPGPARADAARQSQTSRPALLSNLAIFDTHAPGPSAGSRLRESAFACCIAAALRQRRGPDRAAYQALCRDTLHGSFAEQVRRTRGGPARSRGQREGGPLRDPPRPAGGAAHAVPHAHICPTRQRRVRCAQGNPAFPAHATIAMFDAAGITSPSPRHCPPYRPPQGSTFACAGQAGCAR